MHRYGNALAAAGIAACVLTGAVARPVSAACTLREQWRWDGPTRDPAHPLPLSIALVVQLSDDDGDGRIGSGDAPDVAFIGWAGAVAHLHAIDGRDGSDVLTITSHDLLGTGLAAGDLDGDGVVELVAFGASGTTLLAFHHDGSLAWESPVPGGVPYAATLGIADLDSDGSPEIYFHGQAWSATGARRWAGTGGKGASSPETSTNTAIDLDPALPGLEVVAGNTCYGAGGSIAWERADLPDAFSAVGDLDDDGSPEVVLTASDMPGQMSAQVVDRRGASMGAPIVRPGSAVAPPTVADLDGDRRMEVVVPWGTHLEAFEWNGTELQMLWSAPLVDASCCAGASVFDLDGDGHPEVLYGGSEGFSVLDGASGAVLDSRSRLGLTLLELPVIADIDADGIPEILAAGGSSLVDGVLTAYECGVPVPTRCIWNQQGYHVTNVDDDGTIPRVEVAPWTLGLGSLQQESRSCCEPVAPPPDVTICEGSSTTLDASSLADPGCGAGSGFTWRDELGAIAGTGPTLLVAPTTSTFYTVAVDCLGQPACWGVATFRVTVELPPLFTTLRARDPDDCDVGLELTWDAATFRDPSGTGVYDVYRSETSCLDAMTQPPVATGLTALRFVDVTTLPGHSYFYVVQAEDARLMTACPSGPHHGGAVNAGIVCVGPVLESPDVLPPDLLGWALRARHVEDVVTMTWPGSRALLPGEHFHVLKGYDASSFVMVNGEDDLSTTWIETDVSRPLQFFDVRIANLCEIQSLDDEPPGWDVPHP